MAGICFFFGGEANEGKRVGKRGVGSCGFGDGGVGGMDDDGG